MSSKNSYCFLLSVVAIINVVLVGMKQTLTGHRHRLCFTLWGCNGCKERDPLKKKKKSHIKLMPDAYENREMQPRHFPVPGTRPLITMQSSLMEESI